MNDLSQNNQSAGNRPDCEAIAPLLDCYYDNEIDDAERLEVEKHLVNCPACTAELANINNLVQRLKSLPSAGTEIDFADRIEKQILAAQNNKVIPISKSRRWLAPAAAAAAVAIAALVGLQMSSGGHHSATVASNSTPPVQSVDLVAISNPVQNNISEELGIKTDEDGLYAIKM